MSFFSKIAACTALAFAVMAISPATAEASHKGKTHSAQQAKKHGKKHAKPRHHKKGHHKAHKKGAHKK